MMLDVMKKLEKNKEFKSWKQENPDYYLAHAFSMYDESAKEYAWQIGFYSPKKDKLVVITTEPEIVIGDEEDVFKKEGTVKELVLSEVKLSIDQAMKICNDLASKKYSAHLISKRIIMLQKLDFLQYNMTLVTKSFGLINIKIDAKTGEIISDALQNIMGLGDWQKGEKER